MYDWAMIAVIALSLLLERAAAPQGDLANCQFEAPCELKGRLHFTHGVPYSGASVTTTDGTCVPVAAPPQVMRSYKRWEGREIVVSGIMLKRGDESPPTISTLYKDRWLVVWTCPPGPGVLYATELKRR